MSFTSLSFVVFFVTVFAGYWTLSLVKKGGWWQNLWLLMASYLFYGFAEWKMIPLLLVATLVFYGLGLLIAKNNEVNEKRASFYMILSVVVGVGMLIYFKYLNFLIDGFVQLFQAIGFHTEGITLKILMPLGISFFTFRLIAYTIEVHRQRIEPCKNFIAFATYVAFFPTILSGPIDRPNQFLPQLASTRLFTYETGAQGCRLILWGLFMKLCIADRLATYTDAIFNNIDKHNGISLAYPVQMYGDFCGYSNIAIGLGALLGIRVAPNFKRPFFATNIAEYWRRWHISLTSWLTDYVFMPLNVKFRDWGNGGVSLAIIITFVLIGMWHEAEISFAFFGLYHGLLYIPLIMSGTFMKKKKKVKKGEPNLSKMADILKIGETYLLVTLGLILFRTCSLSETFVVMKKILTEPGIPLRNYSCLVFGGFCVALMFVKEFVEEFDIVKYKTLWSKCSALRFLVYVFLMFALTQMGCFGNEQFIYFQF